jgi:hypothetical protein
MSRGNGGMRIDKSVWRKSRRRKREERGMGELSERGFLIRWGIGRGVQIVQGKCK